MNIICKDSSMHRKLNMQQHLAKYAAEANVATGYGTYFRSRKVLGTAATLNITASTAPAKHAHIWHTRCSERDCAKCLPHCSSTKAAPQYEDLWAHKSTY